jgi:hypothetical protein
MPEDESKPPPIIDAGLSVDGDMVDVLERDTRFAKTVIDRLCGQARPMFDAAKPLFFNGRDQLAIFDQARRGIAVISVKAQNGHSDYR